MTADGDVVGAVSGTLWQDTSGFTIVAVEQGGNEVVIPMRQRQFGLSGDQVRVDSLGPRGTGGAVDDLVSGGGAEAIRMISERHDVSLTGPPPGP